MKLTVNLGENSYPIFIENGIIKKSSEHISQIFSGQKIMIVSDDNVFPLYGQQVMDSLKDYECHSLVLPHGEPTKNFQSLPKIYTAMLDAKLTRSDLVIALGGGVIGDLAGFAAASYLRGIRLVQIPTTLLAQVDSSVGGKVGVNLAAGKNLVGAFYPASLVLCDTTVLGTLPRREFRAGLYEVVKYGVIRSRPLFDRVGAQLKAIFAQEPSILTPLVAECCQIKADVVALDERESGPRRVLNFG